MGLFTLLFAVAFGEQYTEKLFADWAKEHGKNYATNAEAIRRYGIFKDNLAWITKRNTELATSSSSRPTSPVSSPPPSAEPTSITPSSPSAMVPRMDRTTGSSRTLGTPPGVTKVTSSSAWTTLMVPAVSRSTHKLLPPTELVRSPSKFTQVDVMPSRFTFSTNFD